MASIHLDFATENPLEDLDDLNARYDFTATLVTGVGPASWPVIELKGDEHEIARYISSEYGDDEDGYLVSQIVD